MGIAAYVLGYLLTCSVCVTGCRVEERVGRQLAVIGDEVDAQYAGVFSKMIDSLSLDQTTPPYQHFAAVARQSVLSSHLDLSHAFVVCHSVIVTMRRRFPLSRPVWSIT